MAWGGRGGGEEEDEEEEEPFGWCMALWPRDGAWLYDCEDDGFSGTDLAAQLQGYTHKHPCVTHAFVRHVDVA